MTRESIEEQLTSSEDEVRYRAVPLIAALEDRGAARTLLVGCLGDPSWRVRKAAGERLLDLQERPSTIAALVAALGDDDNAGMRNAAAEVLARMGSESIVALLNRAEDADRDVRKLVVDILGEIGDRATAGALVERLTDDDENVRGAAAEALGKVGGEEARAALTSMIDGSDLLSTMSALDALARAGELVPLGKLQPLLGARLLRRPVLVLLARLPEADALEGILQALEDPSRGTREAALSAMARWRDAHDPDGSRVEKAVLQRDLHALSSVGRAGLAAEDVWGRAAAFDLVSLAGDASAAPIIVQAARDERLRDRALHAVARLGPAASKPLLRALDHMSPRTQALALTALSLCRDESVVPAIARFLDHDDEDLRLAAVDALRHIARPQAVEPLARLLGITEPPLATAVVRALVELSSVEPGAVRDACRARLGHSDSACVADACRVLSASGSPAEIPLLRDVLSREDPRVREAAAEALGNLKGEEALVQLRYALTDESAPVRAAAARALGTHGGPQVQEVLLVALGDDEPVVVGAVAEALGMLGDPSIGERLLSILGDHDAPGPAAAAYAALRSLARLRAPQLDQAISRAAAHPEGEVAKEAVRVAEKLPPEAQMQVLLACARHPAWDVRYAAAKSLARRREASTLEDLKALASEEIDEMVSEELAAAIRHMEEMVD